MRNDAEYAKTTLQKLRKKLDAQKPSIGRLASLLFKDSKQQYEKSMLDWKQRDALLKQLATEANRPSSDTLSQLVSVEGNVRIDRCA